MNNPDLSADEELQRLARLRVNRKMGFYIHALVFVLVNIGLYFVNETTGHVRWNHFPLMGWGLGLAIHGFVTFVYLDGVRERMMAKELARLKQSR